jgi:hypothetical protein
MGGDSPVRSAASAWDSIGARCGDSGAARSRCPRSGIDVTPATEALEAVGQTFAEALIAFHTSSLTFEQQARQICRCAKSTYHTRLDMGHVLFMNAYRERKERSTRANARVCTAKAAE